MRLQHMCTIIEGVIVVLGSVSLVMHGVCHTKAQSSDSNRTGHQPTRRSACLFYTSGFDTYNSVLNINSTRSSV
jgi:hypothetical protein